MGLISKIEKAISIVEFILKKRQRKIDEMSRKVQLNEREKIYIGEETELIQNVNILIGEYRKDLNRNLGRIPPQDVSLEEKVIGAVILESMPGCTTNNEFQKVKKFLMKDHFYSEAHKIIWDAVLELDSQSKPIDMSSVVVELRRMGDLQTVGGAYYIAELTSKVSSAATLEYNARILVEMAIKRSLIQLGSSLIADGYEDQADCFVLMEAAEKNLLAIKGWVK